MVEMTKFNIGDTVKFKVGDRVKIIKRDFLDQQKDIGNGIIRKIEPEDEGWYYFIFENGYRNSYPEDGLKKMDGVTIGDRVKIDVPLCHPLWEFSGKLGNVTFINPIAPDNFVVEIDGEKNKYGFRQDELELIIYATF